MFNAIVKPVASSFQFCFYRLANRAPFYEVRERNGQEDAGRVQYDAAVGTVTVYVDGNSGNRYAPARPSNDMQYNKVLLLLHSNWIRVV